MVGKVKRLEDRPLSSRRAMERIRTLWKDGKVEILPHAQTRMRERKIDMLDIQYVVRYGRVIEYSKPGQLWRYTVEGTSVDGEHVACVVEINGNLIVVTVID
jgi:hypothetical protein